MISEKNDRLVGSSSSSKPRQRWRDLSVRREWGCMIARVDRRIGDSLFACRSQSAASRISANLMLLFELEYMNRLQWIGWNSEEVMTSVNSSMFTGLMSTMSVRANKRQSRRCKGASLTEALVANIKVPEIYSKIVGGDVSFLIGIDRDGMDVVCVGVGVYLAGNCGDDVVLLGHLWQPKMQGG